MPIVSFRPHKISLLSVADGAYDKSGDFIPASQEWSEKIPCRYEPNGRASTIPVGEGKNFVYEYTVYLGIDCPEIEYGQKVRLYDKAGDCIGEFRAMGFHRCQLCSKLWV